MNEADSDQYITDYLFPFPSLSPPFFLPLLFTAEKWQAVYTILEAFGNSSTSMNSNASRFSHVVSLDFDQAGQVASASIQVTRTRARAYTKIIVFDSIDYGVKLEKKDTKPS